MQFEHLYVPRAEILLALVKSSEGLNLDGRGRFLNGGRE